MAISEEKLEQAYEQVVEKATTDADFRKELLANPNKAIEKVTGIPVPEEYHIRIIEHDPAYQGTYYLPPFVGDEVSDEDMVAVAGGAPKKKKKNGGGKDCIGHIDVRPCAGDVCGVRK